MNSTAIKNFNYILLYIFIHYNYNFVNCSFNNTCPYSIKTNAQVERNLLGVGFHRSLETYVIITSLENLNHCRVLIKDSIPSGAYIDPNELKFIEDFGGPSYLIPQFVNIEASEHVSPKIQAFFFAPLTFSGQDNWVINISVPIHFRYHRAKPSSSQKLEGRVTFPHPSLFLSCDEELPEPCLAISQLEPCHQGKVQMCDWLPILTFSTKDWLHAIVPVGDKDLIETVLLTTTTITCAATLLLLTSIFRKNVENKPVFYGSVSEKY